MPNFLPRWWLYKTSMLPEVKFVAKFTLRAACLFRDQGENFKMLPNSCKSPSHLDLVNFILNLYKSKCQYLLHTNFFCSH